MSLTASLVSFTSAAGAFTLSADLQSTAHKSASQDEQATTVNKGFAFVHHPCTKQICINTRACPRTLISLRNGGKRGTSAG
jgi:hypothetical protein